MDNEAILEKNTHENYLRNLNASNEALRLKQQINANNFKNKNLNNNGLQNNINSKLVNGKNRANYDSPSNKEYSDAKPSTTSNSYKGNSKNSSAMNNAASKGLQSGGVPKPVTDALVNSKLGQKSLERAKKKNLALSFLDKLMGKQKQEEEREEESTMKAVFEVPIKVIRWAIIAMGPAFAVIVFCCLLISASQIYLNSIGIGNADNVSADDAEIKINNVKDSNLNNEVKDVAYIEIDTEKSLKFKNLKLQSNLVQTAKRRPYNEADLEELEDFYPAIKNLSKNNDVYDFYFKMHDLYKTYKKEYNVEIDLPLLMSTLRIQSNDMYEVFSYNLSEEDKKRHQESDESKRDMSNFKYDVDWSSYITTKTKSDHDMEVLAQNMFSNSATETCTDSTGKVTKKNTIRDEEIGTVVLVCDEGETYKVTDAKFGKDEEKYKEFLKQFLEKKYYSDKEIPLNVKPSVKPTTGNNQSGGNSVTPDDTHTTKPNQSNGNYRNWKQCSDDWGNMNMPGSSRTMCEWGCLATSISIQIARSGTYTKVKPFNPGVAIKYFQFSGGIYHWGSQENIAPNFVQYAEVNLRGMSREAIVKKLNEYNREKLYMVIQLSGHYVAVDYVDIENNEIYMLDPARNTNPKLFETYEGKRAVEYVIVYEKRD